MVKNCVHVMLLMVIVFLGLNTSAYAQSDPIERTWYNGHKSGKIQIYKATDGKFYGKIVWLAEPDRDGKPKLDINNEDPKKRNRPVMGMVILKGFKKVGKNEYEDGTVYDPKNGKTYSCKMELNGNKLDVRGYVGISLIGRTDTWTPAD